MPKIRPRKPKFTLLVREEKKREPNRISLHFTLATILSFIDEKGEMYPSYSSITVATGTCRRVLRYHVRELEHMGVLKLKYPANTIDPQFGSTDGSECAIRRTNTYVLNRAEFEQFVRGAAPALRELYSPMLKRL